MGNWFWPDHAPPTITSDGIDTGPSALGRISIRQGILGVAFRSARWRRRRQGIEHGARRGFEVFVI
jgi:hypothetical protein